ASKVQLLKEAAALAKSNDEEYRMLAVGIYNNLDETEDAKKVSEGILKKFSKGIMARNQAFSAIFSNKENTALEKEAAYTDWLNKFPASKFNDRNQSIYGQAAMMLGRELVKDGKYDRLNGLIADTEKDGEVNYALINFVASELINKGEHGQAL